MSALAQQVTERQFQDTITRMAELLGWDWYHTHDSRRSNPGYPDLTLVHPDHGVLFLEVKTEKGRVRLKQDYWLRQLRRAKQRAYVVRPSQVDDVERLLRGEIERLETLA